MTNDDLSSNTVLEHYGVKGMKWGIRKMIQNRSEKKQRIKESKKTAQDWNNKYHQRSSMSDEDLRKAVNRLTLENKFAKEVAAANASLPQSRYRKAIAGASRAVADAKEINKIYNNAVTTSTSTRDNSRHAINLSRVAYQTAKAATGMS